jgi:hypothetical protein
LSPWWPGGANTSRPERSVFKRIARANVSGEMARCPRYTGLDPAVVELLDEYAAIRDQSLSLGGQSRSLIGALSAI